jgi:polyferredoxin
MNPSSARDSHRPEGGFGRRLGLLATLLLISTIALAAFPQGFDQPASFGQTGQEREFKTVQPDERSSDSYFIHDQLIKIAIVGGLSLLGLGVLALHGFRYRKWLLLLPIGLVGFYLGGVLCPLSSVQNIFLKWNSGYMLLFLIPVVLALTVGRVFCGYVCPFGAAQEVLNVRKRTVRIPAKWRGLLGSVKYVILIYLVARVISTGTGILQGFTPFKPLFEWGGAPLTITITAVFAVLSVFLWRPFCQFLCPLGALLSVWSRFSLFRLKAKANCVSCGKCTSRCPAGACEGGEISSSGCYLCGECVRACPVTSLRLTPRWRRSEENEPRGAPEHSPGDEGIDDEAEA